MFDLQKSEFQEQKSFSQLLSPEVGVRNEKMNGMNIRTLSTLLICFKQCRNKT